MCGSKYDWGRFNERTQEWEFPRYDPDGFPPIIVVMRSSRRWASNMAFRAALPEISAAFAGGFVAEMEKEWIP